MQFYGKNKGTAPKQERGVTVLEPVLSYNVERFSLFSKVIPTLLQKFPKTVSYTVIMAVIPKINENSVNGGEGYEISTIPNENRKKKAVFILTIRMEAAFCFNLIE